ncbi:phosphopantetheine-binding protein [Desulfopila sp. IMCC35008]|uniref:phosphopantetheine-binding protein n=1 Tax=Desulfopila sp. IMCC35008 TaxID=2653858 RepID=UPI0013CFBEB1|nr:phosphopantetheine-binding protein [Desulfopila sp. IMCC35008]
MISKEEFYAIVDKGLSEIQDEKPDDKIKGDDTFHSYGVDSLDMMNLLLFLEDELETDLDDIDNDETLTPNRIYDFIASEQQ